MNNLINFQIKDKDNYFESIEDAYIKPPKKIPIFLKLPMWIAKKKVKKDLLLPKILAWNPKTAISSGIMEALITHDDKEVPKRLLKLIRIQISIDIACPFCIDMNSFEYDKDSVTEEEIKYLQNKDIETCPTMSSKEKTALKYISAITKTPVIISEKLITEIKKEYSERAILILASTAAQVNYWARLIRALGVPTAGFTNICKINK
ncbi:carboxymuconolactone decarboxylase family protein [uncultured Brachyspira sp.]|uniref:carboxymuconolactone decarboxylase family protein n=1 Tax=uncultured Brachyspira sp. TaxID=221953 RepID=UPI0026387026|nr:carboxymuconolactone decarboxylase family protein [uncultured Brachyspira sp.]